MKKRKDRRWGGKKEKYRSKGNSKRNRKKPYSEKGKKPGRSSRDKMTARGILKKTKGGYGFVTMEANGKEVFVPAKKMAGAMDRDLVEVEILPFSDHRPSASPEAYITKVIDRNTTEVVGRFESYGSTGYVIPESRKTGESVQIKEGHAGGAETGDKVVAQIVKYPSGKRPAQGEVTEIISKKGDPSGDIRALIRAYGLKEEFPRRVREEAEAAGVAGKGKSSIKGRRDLRDENIITIDGADSKDFDDAVSIKRTANGNFVLGVHIADVSHYVKQNSRLDKEALNRGNSVYLVDQVIPMLPERLSSGICSLNPGEDRLTLSVDMEIDKKGRILSHEIYESLIRSKERMTYDDVSRILEEPRRSRGLIKRYRNIYDDLKTMHKLALILEKRRKDEGSIDFDLSESHITLDENGVPISIIPAERRCANKMIEEFMLAANRTVAEEFVAKNIPFIYRVHERPDPDKIRELSVFLAGIGMDARIDPEHIHPHDISRILEKVRGRPHENVVREVTLRCMQKAVYHTECKGHFGLSMKYYCHFTSPIRRYPDLMIHRIIKEYIHGGLDRNKRKSFEARTKVAAALSSDTERQAIELEREVTKMMMCEFMSRHIGERFKGVVSGVTDFGVFVELENTVEGMVAVEDLAGDYVYEPRKHRLKDAYSKKTITLGDEVDVKVIRADKESRRIDFMIL